MNINTSLSENRTKELWQSFGPLQKEIHNRVGSASYSVEVFEPGFRMSNFTPETNFEKWAAAEVSDLNGVPAGLDALTIPQRAYAKFFIQRSS